MSAFYKTGVFVANTSTGNQAVTGLGFEPKALRLIAVLLTSDTETQENGTFSVGMTDGTNSRCIAIGIDDNVATTNTATDASTNLLKLLATGTPTTDAIASIVSLDADGFTINWSDAPGSAWQIQYEAWGGTDVTNVEVGTWAPSAGTGSKAKTGMAFQPDVVMMASSFVASGSSAVNATMGLSAFTGASQEYAVGFDATDARTSGTISRYWHKAVSLLLQQGSTAVMDATCTSLDAAGWTLNFATHSATTFAIYYMAIKGGKWKAGVETTPTTTTTKQTSGIGFQPIGVSTFGIFAAATTSITAGSLLLGMGGSYGVNTSRSASVGTNNSINQRAKFGYGAKALHVTKAGTGLQQEADLSAWDANSFTLNYTTVSGVAEEFGYVAFGSSAALQTKTLDATETTVPTLKKTVVKVLA